MVFIETPVFRSRAARLLSEDDVAALQTLLMLRPDAGDVIPGSGGVRKVRVPAKGRGKSGGGRVIYYWVQADGQIFLLFAYAKNERANLTAKEARLFRQSAGL
jgi:hypothetical protein